MREVILAQTPPGERVLVVCTKRLFEAERIPDWPDGDERFNDPESYTKRYEWDIEGPQALRRPLGYRNWQALRAQENSRVPCGDTGARYRGHGIHTSIVHGPIHGGRLRTQKMMKEETGEIPLTVLLSSLEHLVVLVHRPQASLKMVFNDG
jgi:hypothetical protein